MTTVYYDPQRNFLAIQSQGRIFGHSGPRTVVLFMQLLCKGYTVFISSTPKPILKP